MVNKVILVGNLGRDPQIRSTGSGTLTAEMPLATNRRVKDSGGNLKEETEWHNVVCFGHLAEVAGKYLSRGRLVYVEGRIRTRCWEDRETGETRHRTDVVCHTLQMLGPHLSGAEPGPEATPESLDDDLPF